MNIIQCLGCHAANEATAKFCRGCGTAMEAQPHPGLNETASVPDRAPIRTEVIPIAQRRLDATGATTSENLRCTTDHLFADDAQALNDSNISLSPPEETSATRAARELARASGLSQKTRFSTPLRALAAGLALLLTFSAWLIYRDQGEASHNYRNGLNLIGSDERSNQLTLAGERFRDQGEFQAAIEQFREALKLIPNNTRAQAMLARTYNAVGRVEEALLAYTNLLDLDPKNLEARLQRAEIYRVRGNWAEATQEFHRIIELDPASEQAQEALAALERPTAERPSVETPLPIARRRNERRATGRYLPPVGDHSGVSLPMSELALRAIPPDPAHGNEEADAAEDNLLKSAMALVYKNRGKRINSAGRYAEAITDYKKALQLTPDDKDLNYLIGAAFHKGGQYATAVEYYRKCDAGVYAPVAQNHVKMADEATRKLQKKQKKQQKN